MSFQNLGKVSEAVNILDSIGDATAAVKALDGMSVGNVAKSLQSLKFEVGDITDILVNKMDFAADEVADAVKALGKSAGTSTGLISKLKTAFTGLAAKLGMSTAALGGWLAAAAAIAIVARVVSTLIVTTEESREKLADLKDEFSEIESELETAESELESISERIDELNAKDTLTFTEQEELENLQAQRRELERIAALRNSEARAKQEEINETFVDTMNKDLSKKDYVVDWNYFQDSNGSQYATPVFDTEQNYIDTQLAQYKRNLDAINQLNEEYADNLDDEYYQNMVSGLVAANDRIEEYLRGKNSEFMTDMEDVSYIDEPNSETDRATNAWLDYINDFQDKMMIAFGEDNAKVNAFNRLVDNGSEAWNPTTAIIPTLFSLSHFS